MTTWKTINQILMANIKESKLTCKTALKILYLWLIHIVRQKPIQHCKVIILQLKKSIKGKKVSIPFHQLFCIPNSFQQIQSGITGLDVNPCSVIYQLCDLRSSAQLSHL